MEPVKEPEKRKWVSHESRDGMSGVVTRIDARKHERALPDYYQEINAADREANTPVETSKEKKRAQENTIYAEMHVDTLLPRLAAKEVAADLESVGPEKYRAFLESKLALLDVGAEERDDTDPKRREHALMQEKLRQLDILLNTKEGIALVATEKNAQKVASLNRNIARLGKAIHDRQQEKKQRSWWNPFNWKKLWSTDDDITALAHQREFEMAKLQALQSTPLPPRTPYERKIEVHEKYRRPLMSETSIDDDGEEERVAAK